MSSTIFPELELQETGRTWFETDTEFDDARELETGAPFGSSAGVGEFEARRAGSVVRRPARGTVRPSRPTQQGPGLPAGVFRHSKLGYVWSIPRSRLAAELEEPEYEVIDVDQRSPVLDTVPVPFRWICRLVMDFGPDPGTKDTEHLAAATGVLISPRHVLTAGHNLYADIFDGMHGNMREIKSVRVFPGHNCAGKVAAPFGSSWAASWKFHEKWKDSQNDQFDYGLITLKTALGNQRHKILGNQPLGWWSSKDHGASTRINPHDPAVLTGKPVNLSGYPGDKCCLRPFSRLKPCKFSQVSTAQFRALGKILDASPTSAPRVIVHDLDTFGGQSGSPIWLRWNEYRNMIAVHIGGAAFVDQSLDGKANAGVRITEEVIKQLCAWGWGVTRDASGSVAGTN